MMQTYLQKEAVFELLNTKFDIPVPRGPIVPRAALCERLEAGLRHKLILLSAPAGFGKTTLMSEWLAAHHDPLPTAWVSLTPGDNDPFHFWQYVFTALQGFDPDAGQAALALLESAENPQYEAILTVAINRLAQQTGTRLLVLEDYHVVTNPVIHEAVGFLLDQLPPALHLVLLTRSDPPLPLARLRASNEVFELRAPELRFLETETRISLQQSVSHPLSPVIPSKVFERTEGWPAGVRLLALALQSRPDLQEQERFLDSFTGSHRSILEYLLEDVIATQEESIQAFFLETSFLDRLTGSLCNAVTGRKDSALILETLERANLFVEPLVGNGAWYRYHPLFAEAMAHEASRRLGEPHLHRLAHRASLWYEEHAMPFQAIETALFAKTWEWAAEQIERLLAPRLIGNEHHTLIRWIQALPESTLRSHPRLCMAYAQAIVFTSKRCTPVLLDRLRSPIEMAEQFWKQEGNEAGLGEIDAFRALVAVRQGDYARAFTLAREALTRLPDRSDPGQGGSSNRVEWRGISLIFTGLEAYYAGKLNEAIQSLVEARALLQSAGNIYGMLNVAISLGEIHARRGEPQQAAELFHQAIAEIEQTSMDREDRLKREGRAILDLAVLAYEANDIWLAEQNAQRAIEISRDIGSEELLVQASWVLARVEWARGAVAPARSRLNALAAQSRQPMLLRLIQAWQAWMALAAGDRVVAKRWAAALRKPGDNLPPLYQEQEALILARVQMASSEHEAALQTLEGWLTDAEKQGRARSELEICLLMAVAQSALGRLLLARQMLTQALEAAPLDNYLRIFLEEGENLVPLLRDVAGGNHKTVADPQAWELLKKMQHGETRPVLTNQPQRSSIPDELLTDQEERVLQFLSAGLSNWEIAQELVISINTVKTHIKNIYRKLQVNNRRTLRSAVREMNLLSQK